MEPLAELGPLGQSVLVYGLPDFGQYSSHSGADREDVRRALEEAIQRFEPRLENVKVALCGEEEKDSAEKKKPLICLSVGFVVTALLKITPMPQPVQFETVLDLRSGKYEVKES